MDLCQSPRGQCDHHFHKFSINSLFFLKASLMIWVFIWGLYSFFLNDIASHCKKPYEPKSFMGPKTACRFFGKFRASNGQRDLDTKKQTAKHLRSGSFLFQSVIFFGWWNPEISNVFKGSCSWKHLAKHWYAKTLFGGLRFQISFFSFSSKVMTTFCWDVFFFDKKARLRKFWDALQWTSVAS